MDHRVQEHKNATELHQIIYYLFKYNAIKH